MKKRCLSVVLCLVVLLVSINPAVAADVNASKHGFSVDGILTSSWTSKIVQSVYFNGAMIGTCCMYVGHATVNDNTNKNYLLMYTAAMEGHQGWNSSGSTWYGYSKELRVYDTISYKGGDELLSYDPKAQSPSYSYSIGAGIGGGVSLSASTNVTKDALTIKSSTSTYNDIFDVRYVYNKPPIFGWKSIREYMFKESVQVGAFYFKKGNWGAQGSYQKLQVTASFYVSAKGPSYNGTLYDGNTKKFYVTVYY